MPSRLACVDGEIQPIADARIPVDDPGLLRGDGVFEAIRLYGERPFELERHLERMRRSATGLRLALDIDAVRADVEALLARRGEGDEVLRILATRGGRRIALFEGVPAASATCTLACVTYAPPRLLDEIKSLSYAANMLASRLAGERGFDDALFVSPHGRVLECPTATFFAVRGDAILTPPLSDHVLDSITRQVLFELADVREQPLELADLERLDEAFVASSTREIVAVSRIEEIGLAAPGPLTGELARRFAERVASGPGG
jgi:branched-chain amino acid aminotransferase